jgi:hypothetical protein
MGQALVQLVPLALAAALSSVPIFATIVILLSASRTRSGLAFLGGTVLGTFATVSLATVAGQALPGRPREHEVLVGRLEVLVGIAMVVLGVVALVRRNRARGGTPGTPGWLGGLGTLGTLPVLGTGLALNLRPKALLLATAAGLAVSDARLRFEENLLLVAVYTAIASCTVVVPVVATILFPERMEPRLVAARSWIAAHATAVSATISIMIGAFVAGVGLTG